MSVPPPEADSTEAGRPSYTYRLADPGDPPQVTVVTRVAGDPGCFGETVRSLQRQSFQQWEWLIAVDEARRAEVSSAIGDDPRTRVVDDLGVALVATRAPYVLLLAEGDQLEPTALEKWIWVLVTHPRRTSVGRVASCSHETGPVGANRGTGIPEIDIGYPMGWTGVIRRETLEANRGRRGALPSPRLPRRRRRSRIRLDAPSNRLAKESRRVLFLVPWVTTGGADKFTIDVVQQLAARGWEVTVVTTLAGDNCWLSRVERVTPDVFALPELLPATAFPGFLRYLVGARRPDVILVSNSLFAYRALPFMRLSAPRAAVVDYCHSVVEGWLDGGYPRLSVDGRDHLDLHITSSEDLKEWMVARGVERDRIEVCYVGTTPSSRTSGGSREGLGLPDGVPLVLYPCRLTHEKQPAVFARTLLALRDEQVSFHAAVVGDGPYLEWLESFVRENRLTNSVTFTGAVSNEHVRELMAAGDCVFLPSKFEGISVVLYEALAEGVPVVGADVGGQRELVSPDCGRLIEPGSQSEEVRRYTAALRELLGDSELRRRMGAAGRARIASRFTLEHMGERMDGLLERARELATTSPRPIPSVEQAREAVLAAAGIAAGSAPVRSGPVSWRLRHAVFRGLSAIGMPFYRLGIRLGAHWLEPLKDRVFRALFPRAE